jgi:N-methylhydantoinase A/oxoprolinase/acetone carboxylase beta subunit
MAGGGFAVGIDIGGTFTDVVCTDGKRSAIFKLPSTRDDPSRAVAEALARLEAAHGVAAGSVTRFCHGTTVATNAVLERKGATVGLIATEGFADILELGRQMRRQMYDLALRPETPALLAPGARRVEVRERIAADGAVLTPLDEAGARAAIARLLACGVEAIAVALLFSFVNPAHERRLAALIGEMAPGLPVSLSSEVDPAFREYERTVVTAFDAYVKPRVATYLARIGGQLAAAGAPCALEVMQSRGGLAGTATALERPVRLFLSGPAAGVLGAAEAASAEGFSEIITIDVGGTSSDIALVEAGRPGVRPEMSVDGYAIRVPTLDVVSIGAGGGSIAWVDASGGLRVGPRSAGAEPGPACYGRGGADATVTDASLMLGYLDPADFAGGSIRLCPARAEAAIAGLAARIGLSPEAAALGIHRVVNAQMADGIRLVSIRRGIDPRGYALVPLGGGGGLHAACLAEELGIRRVLVPRFPGVLAAAGLLVAPLAHEVSAAFHVPLGEAAVPRIAGVLGALDRRAAALMARDGVPEGAAAVRHEADMAYLGQSHTLAVPFDLAGPDPLAALAAGFEAAHARINGHATGAPAKIVNLRTTHEARRSVKLPAAAPEQGDPLIGERAARLPRMDRAGPVPVLARARLTPGAAIAGPAIVAQGDSTTLVPPGWSAEPLASGALLLRDGAA